MQIDPEEVLKIAEQLDPVLIERAVLRHLNEVQAALIEELTPEPDDT